MAKLTKYATGVVLAIVFVTVMTAAALIAMLYLVAYMKNLGV